MINPDQPALESLPPQSSNSAGQRGAAHLDQGRMQVHVVRHDHSSHDAHRLLHLRGAAAWTGRHEHAPENLALAGLHCNILHSNTTPISLHCSRKWRAAAGRTGTLHSPPASNNYPEHEESEVRKDSPGIRKALSLTPASSMKRNKGQMWSECPLPATGSQPDPGPTGCAM